MIVLLSYYCFASILATADSGAKSPRVLGTTTYRTGFEVLSLSDIGGGRLLSVGTDLVFHSWNTKDGNKEPMLTSLPSLGRPWFKLNNSRTLLMFVDREDAVRVYDLKAEKFVDLGPLRRVPREAVIAISPLGKAIAVADNDGSGVVKVVMLEKGAHCATLRGRPARVTSLCFSEDGLLLGLGADDGYVETWKCANVARMWSHKIHDGGVTSLQFASKRSLLISGGEDENIHLLEARSGVVRKVLGGHRGQITALD